MHCGTRMPVMKVYLAGWADNRLPLLFGIKRFLLYRREQTSTA
jgi:hypothetical protein